MTFVPNPRVTVGGVDVTDAVLGEVTVGRGRDDPDRQPRPGWATVVLIDPPHVPTVTDRLVVDVSPRETSPEGLTIKYDPRRLFAGRVSDVDPAIVDAGDQGVTVAVTVRAVGPLAATSRGQVAPGGYPQQLDGVRAVAALRDATALAWEHLDPSMLWDTIASPWPGLPNTIDLPDDVLWSEFGAAKLADVDDGTYMLQADFAGDDPWRIAQQAANDGGGLLYETGDGRLGYTSEQTRDQQAKAGLWVDLPAAATLVPGLRAREALGDLANVIEVTYATGTVVATDPDAIRAVQARLTHRISTRLLHQADAEARAAGQLTRRATPRRDVQHVTAAVHLPGLTLSDREVLLDLEVGTPVRLFDLPATVADSPWTGFLEAVEWTVDRHDLYVTGELSHADGGLGG